MGNRLVQGMGQFFTCPAEGEDELMPYEEIRKLWALRALVRLNGHLTFLGTNGYNNDLLSAWLGCPQRTDKPFSREEAKAWLNDRLQSLEESNPSMPEGTILEHNLAWVSRLLGLNRQELALIRFLALMKQDIMLLGACDLMGNLTPVALPITLSVLLGQPLAVTKTLLAHDGRCLGSGLLNIFNRASPEPLSERMGFRMGFTSKLIAQRDARFDLFSELFFAAAEPRLSETDFAHVKEYMVALGWLDKAIMETRTGVNILIYGPPGTGKTEFARLIGRAAGGAVFEVGNANLFGEPMSGEDRLRNYLLAQSALAGNRSSVILFDEVEDIFKPASKDGVPQHPHHKGWFTRHLEGNERPTIWLSNDIDQIDAALLRRFDLVMEMKAPPRRVREALIRRYAGALQLSDAWVAKVAEHQDLAPAVIERTMKVIGSLAGNLPPDSHEQHLELAISSTLMAMQLPALPKATPSGQESFRLDLLNTDQKLDQLVSGLARHPQARLCLYGPPGTGKSAFARYLAQSLDRPLLTRRASDLLGPYVGMTEWHIAKMFAEAEEEGAVLLLDEADSFLRERQMAHHSWEVTAVNEMLTQMEAFDGIFIATTNLMQDMDAASMRRFDLKVRFDSLRMEQVLTMFHELVSLLGIEVDTHDARDALSEVNNLTPGDFEVVSRQLILTGLCDTNGLLDALIRESTSKGKGTSRAIGFVL